jgi:hypothetical protein
MRESFEEWYMKSEANRELAKHGILPQQFRTRSVATRVDRGGIQIGLGHHADPAAIYEARRNQADLSAGVDAKGVYARRRAEAKQHARSPSGDDPGTRAGVHEKGAAFLDAESIYARRRGERSANESAVKDKTTNTV